MTVTVTYTTAQDKSPTIAYYAANREEAAAWVAKQQKQVLNRRKIYSY